VKLEDGLLIYQSNTKFWEFTLRLERTAADMLKLLVDDNYQPLDDDKRKAHQLLDEIETWKADCDEEKKGN